MAEQITYGEGGYDPSKPDGNVVARFTVDYSPAVPTAEERLAALEAQNTELLAALAKATTLAQIRAAAAAAQ